MFVCGGRGGMRLKLLEDGILPMVVGVLQLYTLPTESLAAEQAQLSPTSSNIVEISAQIIAILSLDPLFKTFIFSPRLLASLVCAAARRRCIITGPQLIRLTVVSGSP